MTQIWTLLYGRGIIACWLGSTYDYYPSTLGNQCSLGYQCVISTTKSPCPIESLSCTSTRLILPDTGDETTDSI